MTHSCESGQEEFFWIAIPESEPPQEAEVGSCRGLTGWFRFVDDLETLGFVVEHDPMMQRERIRWRDGSVTDIKIETARG